MSYLIPITFLYFEIGLSNDIRNGIKKQGFWYVAFRVILMYVILPPWRKAYGTNPFLFKFRMYLTNQDTAWAPFDLETMCKVGFAYIFNPSYILNASKNIEKTQERLQDLGFVPNYANDRNDRKFDDFNNVGLQVASLFSMIIFLESITKTADELYKNAVEEKTGRTIMHDSHPLYEELKRADIELEINTPHDNYNRYPELKLVLPYDHNYHALCAVRVEANLVHKGGDQYGVEHPMLGITHDGVNMRGLWDGINGLFSDAVMPYVVNVANNIKGNPIAKPV